jgi:membrane protein
VIARAGPRMNESLTSRQRRVWDRVSCLPLRSLWNLQDTPLRVIARRTWRALFVDNIFGIAAELGFYFFFSLFPTLFSASFILGLAAHSVIIIGR